MKTFAKRIFLPIIAAGILFVGTGFKNEFFEIAKQIEIFTTLFKELNMNYVDETNPAELMDTAIKSMLDELDPYTVYLNEQDVEEYKIKNAGEYSGIGALVRSYNNKLLVVEVYKDYPADKAGLKAGDEIIKIGDINIADFKDDASELLKGASKSKVSITYKRQGKEKTTLLTRDEIEVDAVPFYGMVNSNTGYIVLSRFNRKASTQTKNALKDLKNKGADKIILDLRDNPGGLLNEAIEVTNLFIPKGELVVTTKSKVKKFNKTYKTRNQPVDDNIPLVVIVNGRSASASEIVSGALQDLDRAVIVGSRSFGKGLVQRPLKLAYGTQLKVTISRYYTPSGRCIQALDYWNRDENGNAVKTNTTSVFRTKNNRKVYDGGGVMPDIQIPSLQTSNLTKALITNHLVFDFATDYYYKNNVSNVSDFKFTDKDFDQFKKYVKRSNFNYQTKSEQLIKTAFTNGETKEFGPSVLSQYNKLLDEIEKSKVAAIDTYKPQLKKVLTDELITRYFYREGLYNYYLKNDEAIQTATAILNDYKKYKSILN